MYNQYGQYYSLEPGLNGGEWIGSGIDFVSNLIGGNQSKKQAERELEALRLQQQITAQNNQAALELEQLRFQNLAAQNQLQTSNMNAPVKKQSANTGLIVAGVLVLALGTAIALSGRDKEKSLNGLVETIE